MKQTDFILNLRGICLPEDDFSAVYPSYAGIGSKHIFQMACEDMFQSLNKYIDYMLKLCNT